MDIPVYLIAGFLDAGKTEFINGILKDGFAAEDRTLLLRCEEGETDYDPRVLDNVFTYTIDEPEQMTPDFFKKLEKQYRPKQVIIEYNGMWSIEPLYREGLPANWILYQIMCLVDANTFEPYVRNMGQLMMEKITNADMLIFNRCNEELRKQLRSRNLRMVNRRADIYLENTDGTSEEYVTPEMSPFDLSGGKLDVPDEDYGIWYVDMMDNPDRYQGVEVSFKAVMCHSKKFKGIHCPGRFAMVCCDKDMQFLALVCRGEGLENFKDKEWVKRHGEEGKVRRLSGRRPGAVRQQHRRHHQARPGNGVLLIANCIIAIKNDVLYSQNVIFYCSVIFRASPSRRATTVSSTP